jgi:acyl carrier protein
MSESDNDLPSDHPTPTFNRVAQILVENFNIPPGDITRETHLLDDLGLDSLELLDLAHTIKKTSGVELSDENIGTLVASGREVFEMENLCSRIDSLAATADFSPTSLTLYKREPERPPEATAETPPLTPTPRA